MPTTLQIHAFFDESTHTITYLIADPDTRAAAVIDPLLDYEHRSGRITTQSAERVLDTAQSAGLNIIWILETHAHADHLSAAPWIKQKTGAQIAIGEHISKVQRLFAPRFNLDDISGNGNEFDRLLHDGEVLMLGHQSIEVLYTPGHTPACVSYRIGDAVFVGDTLFMPDYGTARADFPGGNARQLYRSIQRLLSLPPHTRLFMCHDYTTPTRKEHVWETTVAAQRAHNIQIHEGITEEQFVSMREQRDATLAAPALLLPAIQVNIHAGRLPKAESNGVSYLKVPLHSPLNAES